MNIAVILAGGAGVPVLKQYIEFTRKEDLFEWYMLPQEKR